ncbi:MAG: 2-oxo acid dehydrogenase subunit E2 [Ideonella sp.]|nr:2-oxo acid dehydrogenase subunit E2 [Ideonella sp.]
MSEHVIKMPDIGEGIVEAELVAWHVQVGDAVREDQPLADVMTDKASVEIPSPVAGRVVALGAELGAMLRVGAELIRIDTRVGATAPAPQVAAPPAAVAPPAVAAVARSTPAPVSQPMVAAPALQATPSAPPTATLRPIASPAVRRRAWELGLDLNDVPATGPAGRILHADVDAAAARRPAVPASRTITPPQSTPQGTAPRPAMAVAVGLGTADDVVQHLPVIGLRRRIAMQMQEAKRRIPHFAYVEEVDVTELERLRAHLNASHAANAGRPRGKLTLLPFIVRAIVRALPGFPQINARFDDEKGVIERHSAVHLGIATQTDAGLLVPVMRHAQALDLWACAAELARLADAARGGHITRNEMSGGTLTITSLGALGGIVTTPIINQPEVGIVGVNRIVPRLALRNGGVVERQVMNLSSSFDHRVVDGMDAARFIQAVRAGLEQPAALFVD